MLELAHKAWRLLPEDWRSAGMTQAAALIAPHPGAPPPLSRGAVIAGDLTGRNGIAQSARILHTALEQMGLCRGAIPFGLPSVAPGWSAPLPEGAAVICAVNAPLQPVGAARLPRRCLRGRRIIGMWVWELPLVPHSWRIGAAFVHDIWAPSRFCAQAFARIAPGRVRVVPYPLAACPEPPAAGTRTDFGIGGDVFAVLCAFNLASDVTRKNPLGAIAAFRAAFGASRDVLLVLKAAGAARHGAALAAIREAMGDAGNIRLIAEDLPDAALQGLVAACDAVLSLHRAEGFGLFPATGALLGKPVIATGWSGNLDFMSAESGALVSYKLVPVPVRGTAYDVPGALWAEPEVEEASAWLRRLFSDTALRREMGAAGQDYARRALGAEPLRAALAAAGVG